MHWKTIRDYMLACEMYGWEPSFEGLKAYEKTLYLRKKWIA